MPIQTEERPAPARPQEVVVRVDAPRRRRFSITGALALAGVVLILALVIGLARGWLDLGNIFSTSTVDRSAPVILHRLRDVSSYDAASGTFSVTVDTEKDVSFLPPFIAGERVIYSGYGTVDASVDLGKLDQDAVTQAAGGGIIIRLPPAHLQSAHLDPRRSHVMNRDRGLLDRIGSMFVDNPTSERALERAAVKKIDTAAGKTKLVERAERNTEAMIRRIAKAAGVTEPIDVRFGPAGARSARSAA
jgi:Protein of unknown function (DUF4230)